MPDPSSHDLCDTNGRPLLSCATCARPLSIRDLTEQSLRLPDAGETPADYLDAELLDDLAHLDCLGVSKSA